MLACVVMLLMGGSALVHEVDVPSVRFISPLVIDIEGDGIQTVNVDHGNSYFDWDNDYRAERTAWPYPWDGLLVLDRNGDGRIDHGAELFGNFTPLPDGKRAANGFAALAAFDEDQDGRITPKDPVFAKLRIWQDFYRQAVSTPESLRTLESLGIESIGLQWTESKDVDAGGGAHRQVGTVRIKGKDHAIADVWFPVQLNLTLERGPTDLPPEVAALPHARAFGQVRDLRPAMALNPRLKQLILQFSETRDVAAADRMLDAILLEWTGANAVNPTSRGYTIDGRYLAALERFVGEPFRGRAGGVNPSWKSSEILMAQYAPLRAFLRAQLLAQTLYRDEFRLTIDRYDPRMQIPPAQFAAFTARLERLHTDGNDAKVVDLYCTLAGFDVLGGYAPTGAEALRSHPVLGKAIETALDPASVRAPTAWAADAPGARSPNSAISLGCLDLMRIRKWIALPPPVGEEISSIPAKMEEERERMEAEVQRMRIMALVAALLLLVLLIVRQVRQKRAKPGQT